MSRIKKLPLKREFSAGGCVYRRQVTSNKEQAGVVWLVGKHSGYHKWVLPKGLIEKGERGVETAVREVEEEMGVVARVVREKPIYKVEYWYVASYASKKQEARDEAKDGKPERRVAVYQEDPNFEKSERGKVRVFKTVSFYLMKYVSGDPKDHGWEMEEVGWFETERALGLLAFEGEREALSRAVELVEGKLGEEV